MCFLYKVESFARDKFLLILYQIQRYHMNNSCYILEIHRPVLRFTTGKVVCQIVKE